MRITSGKFRNRKLNAPKTTDTRPTLEVVRKSVFDSLGPSFDLAGRLFLDIFSGSGAMAFEALSRGFERAYLIEKAPMAVSCIYKNAKLLGVESAVTVYKQDALRMLKRLEGQRFDVIFIDPPYEEVERESCQLISRQTLALVDSYCLLKEGGRLFLETSKTALSPTFYEGIDLRHLTFVKRRMIGETAIFEFCLKEV